MAFEKTKKAQVLFKYKNRMQKFILIYFWIIIVLGELENNFN